MTTQGAYDALKQTMEAQKMCKPETDMKNLLDSTERLMRDLLSVRAQIESLPLGNKDRYLKVLEKANREHIGDREMSLLLLSYRKVIWMNFASAFPTNSLVENIQRGRPRQRRERPFHSNIKKEDADAKVSQVSQVPSVYV